jgi:hypothetical protein
MATTPDLGIPYIANQQNQPEVTHNEALNLLQVLANGVASRAVNTPPGGPAQGDAYIIGAAPTGAWAGRSNALAAWFGTAWVFLPGDDSEGTPIAMGARQEGLSVWVRDENIFYTWDGAAWAALGQSGGVYDFGFAFSATPDAGSSIQRVRIGRAITIPANMEGSSGGVGTNPDAAWAIGVFDDGTPIGTITVSDVGEVTFATLGSPPAAVNIAAGSEVSFVAPGASPPEASVADGSFVILAAVQ